MKSILFLFFVAVILCSCGNEKPVNLETFSTEAFAYDLGNSWEVNATTRVKGFSQKEVKNNFAATVAYDIDLVTPAGDTIKALISKVEDKNGTERLTDIPIEVQFDLDSTYAMGDYKVIFNIKDATTKQTASAMASFQLSNE